MEFINSTKLVAGYTMAIDKSGREVLVIAIKGTFRIPSEDGASVSLSDEQLPLVVSDEFFGEPGFSAPKYEIDFAPRKARVDVLLNGSAWAPGGRPTERMSIGVRIGEWMKTCEVVGDRIWQVRATGVSASQPVPFVSMPVSYGRAFGGTDTRSPKPSRHAAFMPNPVGRGFHTYRDGIDGSPLPNTEERTHPVTRPDGEYRPMAFGALGRHWSPRAQFAGTYDESWLDNVFPFLPVDFDERYYQSAPADQQLDKPIGAKLVVLANLTPDGRREFLLPYFEAPVHIFPKKGAREDVIAQVDTIVIEPDSERLTLTWRVSRPLKRDMFEIGQVLVGRKGRAWWQEREEFGFPIPLVPVPPEPPSQQP